MIEAYSGSKLRKEIQKYGQDGYIEQIWVEDLA